MRWTNKFGLPKSIVSAVTFESYKKSGVISITELLLPPRIRVLEQRYSDDIEMDVSEAIAMARGRAWHEFLEKHGDMDNSLSEERLSITVLGWKVSGQFDLNES